MVFNEGQKTSGFASPAQGYEEQHIDLNRLLVRNPPATYFFKLDSGDMEALGLPRGALLVVDRSKTPFINSGFRRGKLKEKSIIPDPIVIIRHEGQFFCRLLVQHNGKIVFTNGIDDIVPVTDDTEIIGTVTASIQLFHSI